MVDFYLDRVEPAGSCADPGFLERGFICIKQGSKITLIRSYLRVPQAAGQVKFGYFL